MVMRVLPGGAPRTAAPPAAEIVALTGSVSSIQHLPQYAMRILREFRGLEVRLTEKRLEHILDHPEMSDRGLRSKKRSFPRSRF